MLDFGCQKPNASNDSSFPKEKDRADLKSPSNAQAKIDASKLLTSEELQSTIGEPLKEAVASNRSEAGFAISQCYFTLSTPSRSVVITVTAKNDGGSQQREPREFWEEKFHEDLKEGDKKVNEAEEEAEHPQPIPKRIEGVGEEAYWVESGQMGALYALKGDRFIRVAIGGNDSEEIKIEKSTVLARSALKRL